MIKMSLITEEETMASQNATNSKGHMNTHHDMVDWWVGTVLLAFFPSILSAIFNLYRNAALDFKPYYRRWRINSNFFSNYNTFPYQLL